ncbi:MAG TPA: hypothetical protein VFR03_18860, partial [Thermoanaerobaculia bacterium]|nr:hypothetical protein [Thermoanaerobaculia bacterium]
AAGSTAELEWAPEAGFVGVPHVEEWEAFLSLDGGATYPLRITPHLDQDLRRVRFQVPPIPTPDARILLRFGDERRETAVELPGRFAIAGSPALESSAFTFPRRVASAGEPALPGQAGAVAWVEGSRRGGGLRQVVSEAPPGLRERLAPPESHGEAAVLVSPPAPPQSQGSLSGDRTAAAPDGRRTALARSGTSPPRSSDILLLIQRQNE